MNSSSVINGLCSYRIGSDCYKAEIIGKLNKNTLLVDVSGLYVKKFTLRKNGEYFEAGSKCGRLDFDRHEEVLDRNF